MKSIGKNIVLNCVKQCCNIIFPFITFPYISRVLGAEMYGKVNFGSSIISYISLLAALGITNYAVREGASCRENKEQLEDFACDIFTINILSTLTAYIVLGGLLVCWPKLNDYSLLILIQSASVLFTTIGVEWLYTIEEDYIYITVRSIIFQIISVVLMLTLVKKPDDYVLYAGISVFAGGGSAIFNIVRSRRYVKLRIRIHKGLIRHLAPLLILFANAVTTVIYVNSDITMLGVLKGDQQVGIYSAATKMYSLVKQIINAAMVVCVPRIAYYIGVQNRKAVRKLLNTMLEMILMLGIPAVIGLFSLSGNVINLFCGKEYSGATAPLQILSFALIFALLAGFETTQILIPYKQDKRVLISVVTSAVVNVSLNLVLIPRFGAAAAAFTTLLSEITVTIMCAKPCLEYYRPQCSTRWITYATGGIMVFIICKCVHLLVTSDLMCIVLSMGLSVILYFGLLFVTRNKVLFSLIKRK